MGFGNRTMGLAGGVNPNLKGDASVKIFTTSAGLSGVPGFPEYLSGVVANGQPLGLLSNEQWQQILGPMQLSGAPLSRATKAINEIRVRHAKEANEQDERDLQNHLINGGAHPHARPNAEVREPKLNGARPKAVDDDSFIPVAYFQGEKEGWTFKHGIEGLGYYREVTATGAAPAPPVVTNVSRGYNPVSQAGVEEKQAGQQRAYIHQQSRQQQLLTERRRRMEERQHGYSKGEVANMYADARLRSSPFATGY